MFRIFEMQTNKCSGGREVDIRYNRVWLQREEQTGRYEVMMRRLQENGEEERCLKHLLV